MYIIDCLLNDSHLAVYDCLYYNNMVITIKQSIVNNLFYSILASPNSSCNALTACSQSLSLTTNAKFSSEDP